MDIVSVLGNTMAKYCICMSASNGHSHGMCTKEIMPRARIASQHGSPLYIYMYVRMPNERERERGVGKDSDMYMFMFMHIQK